ncbi:MAG TPA: NADPH-dependent 7-cyano-7-deazaguanine reductase QueF [Candidatus Omnitrophica bacterium]|nr:MAG: NADPH-dependent 7-cyano-7-deazaguanine reductase QueF [Omnitrophica WOR_2 bacterium GWA2_45_18]OGX21282.1 MAG: NADPH-dependent 7-cyano-7-deazaguanine reductase QueF [Omnitrophica WOR_2 bacterium GWC2_45_7]HBR14237.1 NADPH-dependent 7-cyano-7-deazaguanine reductase QueF [Candidatus Omnitrophota bacterium]
MKKKSSYEELQSHIRFIKTPGIEVWENQYPEREYTIHLNVPECTCICPKTGLPDFAVIQVTYGPAKLCLELKSFKLYIIAYRNVGIFHEHLVNKILDDIVNACHPRWAKVEGIVSPRGGIQTTVTAEYRKK